MESEKITLNFHVSNTTSRGPGMVFQNLMRGLELLEKNNIEFKFNDQTKDVAFSKNTINIVLQGTSFAKANIEKLCKESKSCFVGPNVFVLPEEWKKETAFIENFIVPSEWVYKEYKLRGLQNKKVHIWPVGIDTEAWSSNKERDDKDPKTCFVYFKNRDAVQLQAIKSLLEEKGFKVQVIEYGKYVPAELYLACNNSSFCVNLSNTESQGIGIMEIMAMNVPVFVFDQPFWLSPDGKQVRATSVPYFDERCGIVSRGLKAELLKFLEEYETYNPREYIVENHTLINSAKNFLNVIGL